MEALHQHYPAKGDRKVECFGKQIRNEIQTRRKINAEHDKEDKSNQEEKRKKIDKAMIDINNQVKRHSTGNN